MEVTIIDDILPGCVRTTFDYPEPADQKIYRQVRRCHEALFRKWLSEGCSLVILSMYLADCAEDELIQALMNSGAVESDVQKNGTEVDKIARAALFVRTVSPEVLAMIDINKALSLESLFVLRGYNPQGEGNPFTDGSLFSCVFDKQGPWRMALHCDELILTWFDGYSLVSFSKPGVIRDWLPEYLACMATIPSK